MQCRVVIDVHVAHQRCDLPENLVKMSPVNSEIIDLQGISRKEREVTNCNISTQIT